jgi:transcriptional regulator with XRE-family HTH domain
MSTKTKYSSKDLMRDYGQLSFGEILRSFRLSDEMTLVGFAKKLNITSANLCDLEKGRKIPSPTRAAKIAKKLGLAEVFLIQVALQDALTRDKLHYRVSVAA